MRMHSFSFARLLQFSPEATTLEASEYLIKSWGQILTFCSVFQVNSDVEFGCKKFSLKPQSLVTMFNI